MEIPVPKGQNEKRSRRIGGVVRGLATRVGPCAGLIIVCCASACADEACDRAYHELKRFEAEHIVNSEAAMSALKKGDHCSDLVLNFEDQVDANAKVVAGYAKNFVAACSGDPSKADDLAFYSLDAVLHPPPSTLRAKCRLTK
jgi:hypothetical protein